MSNAFIFGLSSSKEYAKAVADIVDIKFGQHEEYSFSDGEIYVKSNENVRNADIFVFCSLFSDHSIGGESVSEKLVKLSFFIGSLKDASAKRVTAVIPYMGYARQDRKDKSRAPIATKYLAMILESIGTDRILTMDVHNVSAIQNAFRIPVDILEAKNLLAERVAQDFKNSEGKLAILSPDSGGYERAERFRNALEGFLKFGVELYQLDKRRVNGEVKASSIIGDVKGKELLIIDDMIATGSTVKKAAEIAVKQDSIIKAVVATHPVLSGNASINLKDIPLVYSTDTIDGFKNIQDDSILDDNKHKVVCTHNMFAKAIARISSGRGSISELLLTSS